MLEIEDLSRRLHELADELGASGAVLSGDAAAHAWIMAATGTWHGEEARYISLPVRRIEAIAAAETPLPEDVTRDDSPVAEVLARALPLYSDRVELPHGPEIALLGREAVLAQLLARGPSGIPLAALLLRVANTPPIDPDVVREVLKAARLGDRFQPLLELLAA